MYRGRNGRRKYASSEVVSLRTSIQIRPHHDLQFRNRMVTQIQYPEPMACINEAPNQNDDCMRLHMSGIYSQVCDIQHLAIADWPRRQPQGFNSNKRRACTANKVSSFLKSIRISALLTDQRACSSMLGGQSTVAKCCKYITTRCIVQGLIW